MESPCGASEMEFFGDGDEVTKMAEIDVHCASGAKAPKSFGAINARLKPCSSTLCGNVIAKSRSLVALLLVMTNLRGSRYEYHINSEYQYIGRVLTICLDCP